MFTDDNIKKKSSKKLILFMGGGITIVVILLFTNSMNYTTQEENIELVQIIANTEEGCVAETLDSFLVNIGDCDLQSGQFIEVLVDQKSKEQAVKINPPT